MRVDTPRANAFPLVQMVDDAQTDLITATRHQLLDGKRRACVGPAKSRRLLIGSFGEGCAFWSMALATYYRG